MVEIANKVSSVFDSTYDIKQRSHERPCTINPHPQLIGSTFAQTKGKVQIIKGIRQKKRLWCFKNKKHTHKKKRGSTSDEKRGFDVSKIRNTPLKRKVAQPPMKKKRLRCFKNNKHSPKKRGSASDEKRGFDVSKIRNTPLKWKRG
jgi:hypothetical protein